MDVCGSWVRYNALPKDKSMVSNNGDVVSGEGGGA